jgi:ribonuclease T1
MQSSAFPMRGLAVRAVTLFALLLVSIAGGFAFAPDEIDAGALPREGRAVLAAIHAGGPFAHDKDGVTFGNREGALPKKPRGFYREYTVPTPGARNRGARRIVCGAESSAWKRNAPAACYYTDDHYASFRRIKGAP